jgi:hypothetical protein
MKNVDDLELFLDTHLLSWEHNAQRVLQQPVRHERNPLLRCEYPWETQYIGYGSVVQRHDGKFGVWYMSGAKGMAMHGDQLLCYAESDDGVEWRRAMTTQFPYEGHAETNIVMGVKADVHGPCVLRNQHSDDPDQRYLILFDSYPRFRPELKDLLQGSRWCYTATSPDGVRWFPPQGRPAIPGKSDSGQGVVWDPARKRYIAYLRGTRTPHRPFDAPQGELTRVRYIRAAVSSDFERWSEPIELLRADGRDGDPEEQMHQLTVTRRGRQYVGMLSFFHLTDYVQMPYASEGIITMEEGTCDTQLAVSRDGLRWGRVADRQVFLPNGAPGTWDSRWTTTASEIIFAGDRMLFYYFATGRRRQDVPPLLSQLGMAELPRDRFQALRPRHLAQPAVLETKPLYLREGDLRVNADARHGKITVELCDFNGVTIDGFARDQSDSVESDGLDHVVRWKGKRLSDAVDRASLFQKAVRIRFYIHNASLFAAEIPHEPAWEEK